MAENVGYVIGKQNNDALCTMTESRSSSPTNLLQRSDMFSRECSRHFQFSGQHFHAQHREYSSSCTLAKGRRPFTADSDDRLANAFATRPHVSTSFGGVSRRREANARERLRVKNLNSGFAKLRRILPVVTPNRKPSKVDTLQSAIDYIHQLEQLLEATGGIPDITTCLATSGHSRSRQSVTESPFFPLTDLARLSLVPTSRHCRSNDRLDRGKRFRSLHFGKQPVKCLSTLTGISSVTAFLNEEQRCRTYKSASRASSTGSDDEGDRDSAFEKNYSFSLWHSGSPSELYDAGRLHNGRGFSSSAENQDGLHARFVCSARHFGDLIAQSKRHALGVDGRSPHWT